MNGYCAFPSHDQIRISVASVLCLSERMGEEERDSRVPLGSCCSATAESRSVDGERGRMICQSKSNEPPAVILYHL